MGKLPTRGVAGLQYGDPARRLLIVGAPYADPASTFANLGSDIETARDLGAAVRSIVASAPAAVLLYADDGTAAPACEVLRALGDFPIAVCPRPLAAEVATECLDDGADLVLTHDVSSEELTQRMATLIQHRKGRQRAIVLDDLAIDVGSQTVVRGGKPVPLSPTEFGVLAVLANRLDQVVPAREIVNEVWGAEFIDEIHYARLYIGYLRHKIETNPAAPRFIMTHRGAGYRLSASSIGKL